MSVTKKELTQHNLTTEAWREYDFVDRFSGVRRIYRIENPILLYIYEGCTTHRVVDEQGIVHCVPAIGCCQCVLRWSPKPGESYVSF